MPEILLVALEDDLPRVDEAVARHTDATVSMPSGPDAALDRIAANPREVAALVVGPGAWNPIALASRAHAIDSSLTVILLANGDGVRELREGLRLTPHLGEDIACLEIGHCEGTAEAIAEAAERRRRRQTNARVTAALNSRIGAVAAPPALAVDFGRLLDHAPIGVLTVDGQGAIRGTNRRAEALFCRHESELVGQALAPLFDAPEHERVSDCLGMAVQGTEPEPVVLARSESDGEPSFLEMTAVAADIGPNLAGAIVLLQDVTAREQARRERDRTEEALREQQRWFEATVLGIGDAVIAADAQGRVTLMNAAAEQLTGWSQADAAGVDSTRVFHIVNEATGEEVESPVTQVLREGKIVGLANHTILLARDGRRLPIDDSGAPIRDDQGRLTGVVLVFRDVSERRRSEQALRESEQRFRAIFEQAASGIALVGPDGAIREVNERFCQLVGYERTELEGMENPIEALTHPDDLTEHRALTAALVSGEGLPFQLEKRYLHKQGYPVWVRVNASALRDENGQVQQLIGVVEDIDERKRAEDALQASEERLRLILESLVSHAVFVMDREGRVTDWNSGAEHMLGYTADEVIGHPGTMFYTEEDREADVPKRELRRALEDGQASDDRWHVRKDGSRFWASGLTNTLGFGGDEPRGFVKVVRDQTEAKHTQEQLEARARQQATIAGFGHRALSGEALSELMNEAAETVAETLGVEFCEILRLVPETHALELDARFGWPENLGEHARVKPERDSQAGYTMTSARPVVVEDLPSETRFKPPPLLRDYGVVSGMTVVITAEGGQPWGVLGAHSRTHVHFSEDDVNFLQAIANSIGAAIARTRTEQRLRDLNQTLEQRVAERTAETEQRAAQLRALTSELTQTEQRERRRLAQALHDNLQQMLVAAKLQIGSAAKGVDDADATAAVERVAELLDKSIQESRSLTVELSPPVLYEAGLVAGLEWLGRWMREQHGLTLEVEAAADADPPEDDLRVLLFQTARELLFNVVKHAGVDRAEVRLRRDERERIELRVCDRGGGFEPKLVGPSENGGQGFGLFSIRERIARLGGALDIESTPGEGTCVTTAIPETASATAESATETTQPAAAPAFPGSLEEEQEEAPAPARAAPRTGVTRVVIADDHTIVREGLVGVLKGQPDIDVVGEAGDGQAAVELVRHERPDVAVLDVTMPRMNGIEAARIISQEFPSIRVIGLSVHETSDMAGAMRNAGAAVYLNKAGPSNRLLAAIRGQALS